MVGGLILTTDEAIRSIKERLLNGWIILGGDVEAIRAVQHDIYPSETPENENFEYYGTSNYVFLGRKTPALKRFLNNPRKWKRLIQADFDEPTGSQIVVKLLAYRSRWTKKRAVNEIARAMREALE